MRLILIFLFCLIAVTAASAQRGVKEIRFAPGTSSATVTGTLTSGRESNFVFKARKGQTVTIKNSRSRSFDFRVFNEEFDFETEFESSPTLTFEIPGTGDYLFFVRKKMAAPRTSSFSISITIK